MFVIGSAGSMHHCYFLWCEYKECTEYCLPIIAVTLPDAKIAKQQELWPANWQVWKLEYTDAAHVSRHVLQEPVL
jgi:hypothetical protein